MSRRDTTIRLAEKLALFSATTLLALTCVYGQSAPQPENSEQPNTDPSSAPDFAPDPETLFPHLMDTRYWLSGQANFIFQTHPPFHAPYSGPNSLRPNYEKALSRV